MQYYSVTIEQKHTASIFDAKGELVRREERTITQTIRDLPWPTAKMYQDKDPYGTAKIEAQAPILPRDKGSRTYGKHSATKSAPSARPAAQNNAITNAAKTGNLAAAINAGE